jgi:hypothetical protein
MFSLLLSALLLHVLLLLLLILYLLELNYNKSSMNTFTPAIPNLDCHILLPLSKSIMSLSPSTLGDLEILETSALI